MASTQKLVDALKGIRSIDATDTRVALALDKLFRDWDSKKGPRDGLHASSILAKDDVFCYREHVLGIFFMKFLGDLSTHTLRIFLNGWSVHQKWQNLFEESGIAESVEGTRLSESWWLYLTPDAIIRLFGKRWVVEIKSMNTYQFGKLRDAPDNAVRQSHFYMHFTGIPQAIVLVEDKNSQEVKVWTFKYDPQHVEPFLWRMRNIHALTLEYQKSHRLPKRLCTLPTDKRAKECPMATACFAEQEARAQYALKDSEIKFY